MPRITIVLAIAWWPLTAAGAISFVIFPPLGLVLFAVSILDGYFAVATSVRPLERNTR